MSGLKEQQHTLDAIRYVYPPERAKGIVEAAISCNAKLKPAEPVAPIKIAEHRFEVMHFDEYTYQGDGFYDQDMLNFFRMISADMARRLDREIMGIFDQSPLSKQQPKYSPQRTI